MEGAETNQPIARALARPAKEAVNQLAIVATSGKGTTNDANGIDADMPSLERNQPVVCPTTGRVYPALSCFDDESWFSVTKPLDRALRCDCSAKKRGHIVPRNAVNGWLPGSIPVEVTTT